ncbi:DEAD/DEAH box helicase [Agaribacterium sp. ZY112]|uniref:DEAD/DEAH box helicase n=1 Tax=Agaribacterium sp. ZY112 TaxID=3233574 RepID=UPI00352608F8
MSKRFADLGLRAELLKAVEDQGYDTPSPIQAEAIPAVLEGRDVLAAAQTGTGKTAGFSLPILDRLSRGERASANQVRALILCPTRELAAQVAENVAHYSAHLQLSSAVVFGGVKINPQMQRLRRGVDVLVATPGRLLDLHNQNAVKFKQLEVLVFDEADRMLDMGFIHDIKRILKVLPKERQSLMFSATFSKEIRELAKSMVRNPVEISVTPRNAAAKTVKQWLVPVDKKQKARLLIALFKQYQWQQVLIFCRTKHGANKLTKQLIEAGIQAAAIHGNKSQGARTRALAEFKDLKIRALVATDIAARGIDIDQLPQVVNHDLPNVPEDYVHRIGRTGRAGATGEAVSLVAADEHKLLVDIERLIGKLIDREYEPGFEPSHELPASTANFKPKKIKKPKKPKSTNENRTQEQGNRPARNATNNKKRKDNHRNSDEHRDGQKPTGSRHKRRSGNSSNKTTSNNSKASNRDGRNVNGEKTKSRPKSAGTLVKRR